MGHKAVRTIVKLKTMKVKNFFNSGYPQQILLVDDSETIRKLAQCVLEDAGYQVRTAENGQQAIELLQNWRPDLIILDMMMPVMDGLQFLAWRNQQCPALPVLALTGMRREDSEMRILNAGATAVLFKPAPVPELLEQIAQLLKGNQRDVD